MSWSRTDLAMASRWSPAQTRAIAGRVRGDLLGRWGENLERRFGPRAVEQVRRRLEPPSSDVPLRGTARQWVSVVAQLEVSEAIIDEHFGGDALALAPVLHDDVRQSAGRMSLFMLRQMGTERLLRMAPTTHRQLYDVGDLKCILGDEPNQARLVFSGSELFDHPTWRLLQVFATETMLELAGSGGEVHADPLAPGAVQLHVAW